MAGNQVAIISVGTVRDRQSIIWSARLDADIIIHGRKIHKGIKVPRHFMIMQV
jgi:hypothetical protein